MALDGIGAWCNPNATCPRYHVMTIALLSQCPLILPTHLLPGPQAIVLLEFALVIRNAVLAENPAANCQYRALSGKAEVAVAAVAASSGVCDRSSSCGFDVPGHFEEWRGVLDGLRGQWVVRCVYQS